MSNSIETKSKALIYEFKDDPAAIVPSNVQPKDTVRVGVTDSTFGMTRLDDTLCNGEAVFLRFDYTDHLHITHHCGAEMRIRVQKTRTGAKNRGDGKWFELKCWKCHSEYMPYRQVGDMDLSPPLSATASQQETKNAPIRLRNDVCGFNGLFYLAGYDQVVNAAQHPVSTVEDDRFGVLSTQLGLVKIQVDRHRHIGFVHELCGRPMRVKITHVTDSYDKDFVYVACRCKRFKEYNWLRKVVVIRPQNRAWEAERNKPAKEPATPIDWNDAVLEHDWGLEPTESHNCRVAVLGYIVRALRDLSGRIPFKKPRGDGLVTWYHPSKTLSPWVHCMFNNEDRIEVSVHEGHTLKKTCFDVEHRNDAVEFIRKTLTFMQ